MTRNSTSSSKASGTSATGKGRAGRKLVARAASRADGREKGPRRPPRRWGQHFLADARACWRIVEAFAPSAQDAVLEIGPGRGALTRLLAGRVRSLVAVEIDRRLAEALRGSLAASPSARIVNADVLDLLEGSLEEVGRLLELGPGERMRIIGNLPYSIGTVIVRRLLGAGRLVSDALVMVQREVASRLLARPGSRDYGYISVLVALGSRARPVLELGPGAFRPAPRVRSTVLALEMPEYPSLDPATSASLESVLKAAFAQRRKMLVNSLRALPAPGPARLSPEGRQGLLAEALRRCGIPQTSRPEQVSPDQYVCLARLLYNSRTL